jgi:hypothetical protein
MDERIGKIERESNSVAGLSSIVNEFKNTADKGKRI